MNEEDGLPFLLDALPLVATYLFSPSVTLESRAIGLRSTPIDDEEGQRFFRELRSRHVLACAKSLAPIIADVERRPSSWRTTSRAVSRGQVRGRLDVPRYLGRATRVSLPREYPVIVSVEDFGTPENVLAVRVIREILSQLASVTFPGRNAESVTAARAYLWLRARTRRSPWSSIRRSGGIRELKRSAQGRIARRQTGNEAAYTQLLQWVDEWTVDVGELGDRGRARVAKGLVAFPVESFFWERVLEIWSLQSVCGSLKRLGLEEDTASPLYERDTKPVFTFRLGPDEVAVWFQRQVPMGAPRWRYGADYAESSDGLSGIPDVVVTRKGRPPYALDAKARVMDSRTRPEETYKMLGYFENFRDVYEDAAFHGALVFQGDRPEATEVSGPHGDHLMLLCAATGVQGEFFRNDLDRSLQRWLTHAPERWAGAGSDG